LLMSHAFIGLCWEFFALRKGLDKKKDPKMSIA